MQTLRSSVKDVQRDKKKLESQIIDILNTFEDEYGVELKLGAMTRVNIDSGKIEHLNISATI